MVWKTEIVLANHARGMCFDSDKVHKMLVRAADTPKVLWVSPRPGVLHVQTPRPIRPELVGSTAYSIRAKEITYSFTAGDKVAVAGIVNATRQQRVPNGRGKRVPVPEDMLPEWFDRQLGPGMRISSLNAQTLAPAKGSRPEGQMIHSRTGFLAVGQVTDPGVLVGLLETGIGRGKRFGCGLLTAKGLS